MGIINLEDIQPGMILDADVKDYSGRILLDAGSEITDKHLRICKMWGVTEAHIRGVEKEEVAVRTTAQIHSSLLEGAQAQARGLFRHTDLEHPFIEELLRLFTLRMVRHKSAEDNHPLSKNYLDSSRHERFPTNLRRTPTFREPGDLLKGYTQVSSLPMIYARLNETVNNPQASMSDIARVIGDDPGLSARLLRLVNSAFYGFPSKIDTITRAVVIVGVQQLRDLALGTSIVNLFKGIPEELVSMESFWQHSIACGVAAKILATYRRETNVERFLVAGIVHDIGRLIINTKIPDQAHEALLRCKSNGELLYMTEHEVIGFDHAAVGHALLEAWNLPASLKEVVALHHNPCEAQRFPMETAIVHVADIIAHAMQLGSSGEHLVPPLDERAWESIGLPTSILSPTLHQLERQVNEVIQTILPEA